MLTSGMYSSATPEWATPQALFDDLHKRFNFTLDVCATEGNAKCELFYSEKDDGLSLPWHPHRCFMNPPYGATIGLWCAKAHLEASKGTLVVGLLPARTDTKWWQDHVAPYADIRFLRGRLRFGDGKNTAPFPSALAIWWGFPLQGGAFEKMPQGLF